MLCPSWLLAAAVLCFHSPSADGRCFHLTDCMSLQSNEQKLQCIRQCRYEQQSFKHGRLSLSGGQDRDEELEENESVSLVELLSSLSGEAPRSDERRSYSMEHFRWGKPMGRKRRPVKVFTNGALEDEQDEPEESEEERVRVERGQSATQGNPHRNTGKSTEKYRMMHFRWNTPPVVIV